MTHKIGFIGFGGIASGYHYDVAKDRKDVCPNIEPYAVYDVRQSRRDVAIERGLIAYDNLEDFLANDEIDIVVVATPNQFHCEYSCKALEAGKHVICEKPAAMSPAEFQIMSDTSKKCGKLLLIHQNRRTDRDFMVLKHAKDTGRFGKIYNIESKFCGGLMTGWRCFKDHGGGIFYDWGVHLIDQMVYLMNEPVKTVYADLKNEKSYEVDDNFFLELIFESGTSARITVSGTFLPPHNRFEVYGEKGILWTEKIFQENANFRHAKKSEWTTEVVDAYNENGVYPRESKYIAEEIETISLPGGYPTFAQDWAMYSYRNMIDAIDGRAEMNVTHEQVMTTLRIIDAAFESSKTGKAVQL